MQCGASDLTLDVCRDRTLRRKATWLTFADVARAAIESVKTGCYRASGRARPGASGHYLRAEKRLWN
jgi:hypothetical protein